VVDDARVVGGQGYIVGTMDYIAPEQTIDAARVDRRSDIYSLGCTLYFALSGQPPFPGGTSKEKIHRHRREMPTPLAERVPGLPPGFVALVERLMDKNPDNRPATAAEVERELRSWVSGQEEIAAQLEALREQPLDMPEDMTLDEATLFTQGQSSSEYNLVNLPEVEVVDEEPEGELPDVFVESVATSVVVTLLTYLGIGLGALAVAALLVALILTLMQP
jgi:serine/threonine protein kinase